MEKTDVNNVQMTRGEDAGQRWMMAEWRMSARLAGLVPRIVGYEEASRLPIARDELPSASVVVIIEQGPALTVHGGETVAGRASEGGFVAGIAPHPTHTSHDGYQRCVQIDLRPTTASRLLGIPARDLHGQVLPLRQLCPGLAGGDPHAPWSVTLGRVEAELGRRLETQPWPSDQRMRWAEDMILQTGGTIPIRSLWRKLALSERQFIAKFKQAVGMTPKRLARLARFEVIVEGLDDRETSLAEVALRAGCYDQAHLNRECRAFARMTPSALRELRSLR